MKLTKERRQVTGCTDHNAAAAASMTKLAAVITHPVGLCRQRTDQTDARAGKFN